MVMGGLRRSAEKVKGARKRGVRPSAREALVALGSKPLPSPSRVCPSKEKSTLAALFCSDKRSPRTGQRSGATKPFGCICVLAKDNDR